MMKIAILLTVYNRRIETLESLKHLHNTLSKHDDLHYEIFMVNDGCTDGTELDVERLFPNINIINSRGNLYWSRGMNLAWKKAIKQDNYDFYLWFNDDAILFEDALHTMFEPILLYGPNTIVSGAFHDSKKMPSYGGRDKDERILEPNGTFQDIYYMNGNLVLITNTVLKKIGMIDSFFHHGFGDWDYGLRARNNNIRVLLTTKYVGLTDRHDSDMKPFLNNKYSLLKRLRLIYSPKYSVVKTFYFQMRHNNFLYACLRFLTTHLYTIFPVVYKLRRR